MRSEQVLESSGRIHVTSCLTFCGQIAEALGGERGYNGESERLSVCRSVCLSVYASLCLPSIRVSECLNVWPERMFSLVGRRKATYDEGLKSWGLSAAARDYTKLDCVVTSRGWDRSSPRAGLAGLNTFATTSSRRGVGEGVGGGPLTTLLEWFDRKSRRGGSVGENGQAHTCLTPSVRARWYR
jgi:hypothetical protein